MSKHINTPPDQFILCSRNDSYFQNKKLAKTMLARFVKTGIFPLNYPQLYNIFL